MTWMFKISYLLASSVTYTTSKHLSLLIITAHSIPLRPPEVITFHLSLNSPPLTLGDIPFSSFLCNTIPLYILEDGNRNLSGTIFTIICVLINLCVNFIALYFVLYCQVCRCCCLYFCRRTPCTGFAYCV